MVSDETRHSRGGFECPIEDCDLTIIGSWSDLHEHVEEAHPLESMYAEKLTHKTLADRIKAARDDALERDIEAHMYGRDVPDHIRPDEELRDLDWLTTAADAEPGMDLVVSGPDGLERHEISDTLVSKGELLIEITSGKQLPAQRIDASVWMVVDAAAANEGVLQS